MVKARIALRNVSNVAASKTAIIDVPIGQRYHYIQLQHGYSAGTNTIVAAATNISEIRVMLNGRVQRVYSGTQLRDLNIGNGTAYDCTGLPNPATGNVGVSFPLYFAEPWRYDEADQDRLAWPTVLDDGTDKGANLFDSFQIQVDLGAASTPTLVAYAVVDNLKASKDWLGIVKHLRYSIPSSGTKFDWAITDKRDFLQQVSLYPDSGGSNAATPVTFRVSGTILHELTSTANVALNTQWGMAPAASGRTANIYDLVIDHDGLLSSAVNMNGVRDATITIEAASAMSGTITAIVQRLGPAE